MKGIVKKMQDKHPELIHAEGVKVCTHTQRKVDEWVQHTVTVEGFDVPFKFRRRKKYRNLQGQKVNITYYAEVEVVAGFDFEIMKIVRIKRY